MEANLKIINTFATRVRQLILLNRDLRKKNAELYSMVNDHEKVISDLKSQIERLQHDYDTLKLSKMLEITDGDIESARTRINKLIRDINRCITLIGGKQEIGDLQEVDNQQE